MSSKPEISIVMPAYNVEKYIAQAIESVLAQTFADWELIVIDDGSRDGTCSVVRSFQDERIVLLQRDANSGSAYVPRSDGIEAAQGEWIVNLDADDFIEDDNLERLLGKAKAKSIEICSPQMVLVDEAGRAVSACIPEDGFDFGRAYSGEEAFKLTVPQWQIGMNGALIKKVLWERALALYDAPGKREIHDDENLSRILLLEANGFSPERTRYFIRANPTSVTKKFTLNSFGWMKSNEDLLKIAENRFGRESEEYRMCLVYDYYCYKSMLADCIRKVNDEDVFNKGLRLLRKWHDRIEWPVVAEREKGIKTRVFRCFWMALAALALKNPNRLYAKVFIKKAVGKVEQKIKTNKYYAWHVTRRKRERLIRESLNHYYTGDSSDREYDRCVVCMYDGAIEGGGLADRLKGIIGTYYIAKMKGMPFRLYFMDPFPLADFLVPNKYDWSIGKSEICRSMPDADVIILDNTQDSGYQIRKQKKYLESRIGRGLKQTHVYTNASFSYGLDYSEMFLELFRPSERLQAAIEMHKKRIGSGYISISCRFLDLLGDFNETHGSGGTLTEAERDFLLNQIDRAMTRLHQDDPDKKILVNSDSTTFLERCSGYGFTYIIPGNITHIDAQQDGYAYEKYEKTFLDFLMIANAEKVYLLKSDRMHKSGYPYAASRLYAKPFEIIEI